MKLHDDMFLPLEDVVKRVQNVFCKIDLKCYKEF